MQSGVPADTDGMPVRLHHIVVDAHDLPGLARFWAQALGWKVLSAGVREIVIGTDKNATVGMCFMAVTDPKTAKHRVHLDLTSSAGPRAGVRAACRVGGAPGRHRADRRTVLTVLAGPRETSSARYARKKRSPGKAQRRSAQTDPVRGMSERFRWVLRHALWHERT